MFSEDFPWIFSDLCPFIADFHEDPLFQIRREEQAAKESMRSNPLILVRTKIGPPHRSLGIPRKIYFYILFGIFFVFFWIFLVFSGFLVKY